jgi:predicted HTH domain antitoxin
MTFVVDVPQQTPISELEMKIILGGELYERGFLSLGQAATLAGLTKRTFIEIMGKYGFSIFQQSEESLLKEIENV